MTLPDTHTVDDVAAKLRCSAWWVRRQVHVGRVTPLRLGDGPKAPMRFTDDDVAALYASLRPAPTTHKVRRRRRAS